jgi:hypothetical protein
MKFFLAFWCYILQIEFGNIEKANLFFLKAENTSLKSPLAVRYKALIYSLRAHFVIVIASVFQRSNLFNII